MRDDIDYTSADFDYLTLALTLPDARAVVAMAPEELAAQYPNLIPYARAALLAFAFDLIAKVERRKAEREARL